jgi:hypothetical protein
MSATRRPALVLPFDARELLEQVLDKVTDLDTSHQLLSQRVGAPGPEGKGGTGLVGEIAELKVAVKGFSGLRSLVRGILIGAAVAAALVLFGVGGALKVFGTGLLAGG